MLASDKIKEFIASVEGFRSKAYKPLPTDRWTIGYGSTYIGGEPVEECDIITEFGAKYELDIVVNKLATQITKGRIPASVTQHEFDAVVSLVYNIGMQAFKTSATGKLFYAGLSISEKFQMWNRSNGQVIAGLTNRRAREREIYDTAVYPS